MNPTDGAKRPKDNKKDTKINGLQVDGSSYLLEGAEEVISKKAAKRPKRPGEGRPSKYDPKYCQEIIAYFDVEHFEDKLVERIRTKGGEEIEKFKETGNPIRFISGFARSIGVSVQVLHDWKGKHPEFLDAFTRAKELQEEMLVSNAMKGLYNPHFTIFAAKNMIGWRDRTEIEHNLPDEGYAKLKALSVSEIQAELDKILPKKK